MWNWGSPEFLGIFIAFVTVLFGAVQYILYKMFEYRTMKFEQYNALIEDLIQAEAPEIQDRHIVVVSELASFKKYYPVTIRILTGLKKTRAENKPLTDEIDASLQKIETCMMMKSAVCSYVLLMIALVFIVSLMPGAI